MLDWEDVLKIIIPGFIAFLTGAYFARREQRRSFSEDVFLKVYSPIHSLIEPYKFKDEIDGRELLIALKMILFICEQNKELVHSDVKGKLLAVIERYRGKPKF